MAEIRPYQTKDYPIVRDILEQGGIYWEPSDNENSLDRKIQQNPDSILVAEEEGNVVGTIFLVDDFMPFIFRLAVHPDYRGRGIGKALGQRGRDILREKGHTEVNILVAADDTGLQESYERRGYEKGNTYVWMGKELQ